MMVLFAVVLLSIAGVAKGQEIGNGTTSIQYDGVTHIVPVAHGAAEAHALTAARHAAIASAKSSRPKYVEMIAALANFDADADPDGWRIEVVLFDERDRPVVKRSNATFELMPRVPTADHYSYVDAARLPIRWSMNLKFDEDGVARVKLPLRESLRPLFGWPSAIFPYNTQSRISRSRLSSGQSRRIGGTWRSGSVVTSDWRNQLGRPSTGEIRVRVSVPGEGVFRAATIVPIRPSSLVDTQWPYR